MQETRASVVAATTLVHISVTDEDPVVAQSLANGVSQAFVARVKDLIKSTTTSTGSVTSTPPVSIAEPANLPVAPLSNGLGRDLTLSGIFGLLAGIALVLLLDYLDLSVRTPEDLERKIGLPLLGVIPLFPDLSERQSLIGGTAIRRPDRTLERLDG
jgi:capsular polysaccharide biosynthesis protein